MPSPKRAFYFLLICNLTLIVAAVLAGLFRRHHDPSRYFGDGRPLSFFSCFQLFATGVLAFLIFRERIAARDLPWWRGPILWALISAGFVFLAFDQAFDLHNKFDKILHQSLQLEKTGLSDRLDDIIIGGYGLIGLGVMWSYRRETRRFAAARKPLIAGFACLALEVLFDAASNRRDVAEWIIGEGRAASRLHAWMAALEGVFTLLAEALFIAAFYHAWRLAVAARRALTSPASPDAKPAV